MVNIIETVSQISRYQHSRHPIRKYSKIRVFRVSKTIRKVSTMNIVINKVNIISRDRSAAKLDQAGVVALADQGKALA